MSYFKAVEVAGVTRDQKLHKMLDKVLNKKQTLSSLVAEIKIELKRSKEDKKPISKKSSINKYTKTSKSYDTAYLTSVTFKKYLKLIEKLAIKYDMKLDKIDKVNGSKFGEKYNTYKVFFFSSGTKNANTFRKEIRTDLWPKLPNPLSNRMK